MLSNETTSVTIARLELVRCVDGVNVRVLDVAGELADIRLSYFQSYDGDPIYRNVVQDAAAFAINKISAAIRRPLLANLGALTKVTFSLGTYGNGSGPERSAEVGLCSGSKGHEVYFADGRHLLLSSDELIALGLLNLQGGSAFYTIMVRELRRSLISQFAAPLRKAYGEFMKKVNETTVQDPAGPEPRVHGWELAEAVRNLPAEDVAKSPELMRVRKAAESYFGDGEFPTRIKSRVDEEIAEHFRPVGSDENYVTPDGFVKLPDKMQSELGLEAGGPIWFIRLSDGSRWRWMAWNAAELDKDFGFRS
jgi:hypothetical protein